VQVNVTWGKEKFDLDIDPNAGLEELQALIFARTNVPVDRQKLLLKGKIIKTNDDVSKLTDGAKLMLMGSANAIVEAPKEKVVFEEDLTHEQKTKLVGILNQVGLKNLGNTCYMNSTLQCLRGVPELKKALSGPPGASAAETYRLITQSLGGLYKSMDRSAEAVMPVMFCQAFRMAFPQFDQVGSNGVHSQQDAEECLSQLLTALGSTLKEVPRDASFFDKEAQNAIDALFSGKMDVVVKPVDPMGDPEHKFTERFRRLQCHIGNDTNFLHDGVLKSLTEEIEKKSATLGVDTKFLKQSRIASLPPYLIVQFVRFYWKKNNNKKAKILRRIQFPLNLDILPYCNADLSACINAKRAQILDDEARKMGLKPLSEIGVVSKSKTSSAAPSSTAAASSSVSASSSSSGAALMDVDEQAVAPRAAQPIPHQGYYELQGVITHIGRDADAGHYIGWVKQAEDEWLKFDDDVVTTVTNDDILKLSGGGDWHTAYILLYRLSLDSDPPKPKPAKKTAGL